MDYREFLRSKITVSAQFGFDPDESKYSPTLKPHQRDTVTWALRMGRALVAESFGLGKTRSQCEIALPYSRFSNEEIALPL